MENNSHLLANQNLNNPNKIIDDPNQMNLENNSQNYNNLDNLNLQNLNNSNKINNNPNQMYLEEKNNNDLKNTNCEFLNNANKLNNNPNKMNLEENNNNLSNPQNQMNLDNNNYLANLNSQDLNNPYKLNYPNQINQENNQENIEMDNKNGKKIINSLNNLENNKLDNSIKLKPLKDLNGKDNDDSKISEMNKRSFDPNKPDAKLEGKTIKTKVINENRITSIVMKCLPGTNKLLIYEDHLETKIHKKEIYLNNLFNNQQFLPFCSWVNYDNNLYISGGEQDSTQVNTFFSYNYKKDQFLRLSNMKNNRSLHSSTIYGNYLYVVGGKNSNKCEKYDFKTQLWSDMPPMLLKERINPILFMHKKTNFLYCFFGVTSKNDFISSVERIKIDNPKGKWEVVLYRNESKVDILRINCGVVEKENKLIFVGGISKDGPKKSFIFYDFITYSFNEMVNDSEEENCIFTDNRLLPLNDNHYGNFNKDMEFKKFKFDD